MSLKHPTLLICKGDSLDLVQNRIGLSIPPELLDEDDGYRYFYHLTDLGFWVFFNEDYKVYSIRFDYPYSYAIEGVQIGDTKEEVITTKGKPTRYFPVPDGKSRWIYDIPHFMRIDFDSDGTFPIHLYYTSPEVLSVLAFGYIGTIVLLGTDQF